jgi:hypothetical protein
MRDRPMFKGDFAECDICDKTSPERILEVLRRG